MQTLFEIEQKYLDLIDSIEEAGGEVSEEQEKSLEIVEAELKDKSKAYIELINSQKSYVERIEAEMKRLQTLKNRSNTLIGKLEDRLIMAVEKFGDIKFDKEIMTVSIKETEIVEITNVEELEDRFVKIKTVSSPDKLKIKMAIKNNETVFGAKISKNQKIQIK